MIANPICPPAWLVLFAVIMGIWAKVNWESFTKVWLLIIAIYIATQNIVVDPAASFYQMIMLIGAVIWSAGKFSKLEGLRIAGWIVFFIPLAIRLYFSVF